MKVGFELEVSSGARNVVDGLRAAGLSAHDHLHGYHCTCSECQPGPLYTPAQLPFKAQQDCTADGEFISGILEYGSRTAARAIRGLSAVLLATGAGTTGNVGNHVHVDAAALRAEDGGAAILRLFRLFYRYQDSLIQIAEGGRSRIRRYNEPMQVADERMWSDRVHTVRRGGYGRSVEHDYLYGSYLMFKGPTVEFRLWNSTRAAWRIRTNVGLSHAMVTAAVAGEDCTQNDPRPLEAVIGQYIDGPTWAGILRQRFAKGGMEGV